MDWASVLVSGLIGFAVNHFGGFSKEYFDERKRIKTHKREVARKVLDICTVDIDKFFGVRPNIEHILEFDKTVIDLTAIDKDMGEKLEFCTNNMKRGGLLLVSSENLYRDELIAWANAVRVGKIK